MKINKIIFCLVLSLFTVAAAGCAKKNVTAHGRIELDEVHLSSKITGVITELGVCEGDEITAGELLGELDLYDKTKKDLARAEALYKTNALAEDELENARIAFRDQCIIAPLTGVVLLKAKFKGDTVVPGQTILSLGNLGSVYAKIYVPERDIGTMNLGQKVSVKVDSFPKKPYEGKIIYIANIAEFTPKNVQTEEERARRVYAVKIKIDNDNQELKPGMYCDAFIKITQT